MDSYWGALLKKPKLNNHLIYYELQEKLSNYLPLTFLSFLPIKLIGKLKRGYIWDAQFVGAGYKRNWTSKLDNCFIWNTGPDISEEQRIGSFLNSTCSLGFSSDGNIENSVVTERVAEGLSLGNIVISDNKTAYEWTDGIVEYVSSFEELQDKISFFKRNPEIARLKQEQGYSWSRDKGTYTHLAQQFILKSMKI